METEKAGSSPMNVFVPTMKNQFKEKKNDLHGHIIIECTKKQESRSKLHVLIKIARLRSQPADCAANLQIVQSGCATW